MSQSHGLSYTVSKPEIVWNNREGWTKVITYEGVYEVLDKIATKIKATDTNKGLVNVDLRAADKSGYGVLVFTYKEDILFQWTFLPNYIESSIFVSTDSYDFVNDLTGATLADKSGVFNRAVHAIENCHNKGITWANLLAGSISSQIYGYEVSQSIASFRADAIAQSYNVNQWSYINGLFSMVTKGIESFPVDQLVLRRSFLVNNYDFTFELYLDTVNKMLTKTAIKNRFGGAGSPIPVMIDNALAENYYLVKLPQIEQQNTGKLLINSEFWYTPFFEEFIYGTPILT